VRITRSGRPIVDIVPVLASRRSSSWLGSMRDQMEITGDIVGPIRAFDGWEVR
jgi:antitoxin (DNA-binding transcriptional repressor) of toxin-antitoxin stability system